LFDLNQQLRSLVFSAFRIAVNSPSLTVQFERRARNLSIHSFAFALAASRSWFGVLLQDLDLMITVSAFEHIQRHYRSFSSIKRARSRFSCSSRFDSIMVSSFAFWSDN
jgi:hypothetical protein